MCNFWCIEVISNYSIVSFPTIVSQKKIEYIKQDLLTNKMDEVVDEEKVSRNEEDEFYSLLQMDKNWRAIKTLILKTELIHTLNSFRQNKIILFLILESSQ